MAKPPKDNSDDISPELRDAVKFKSIQIADEVERRWGKKGMLQRVASLSTAEKNIIAELTKYEDAKTALLNEYRASPNYDAKRYASGKGRDDAVDTGLPNH